MEAYLQAALKAARTRLRLVTLAVALTLWLTVTTCAALTFVVWDHGHQGGVPAGAATVMRWFYVLASVGWLAAASVFPLMRRVNDAYLARLIERAHPELRNDLIAALQIGPRGDLPGSIITAVAGQAVRDLTTIDPVEAVPTKKLRRLVQVLLTLLAIFGVYSATASKPVAPSLKRAIGWNLPAPTRTWLGEVLPADGASVLQGEPVVFSAQIRGRGPESAIVRFCVDGRNWLASQELKLVAPAADRPWEAVRAGQDVQQSIFWQVIAGDARSELRKLNVRPVPKIVGITVQYAFPRYTRLPAATQPGGDIDAVVGTIATASATSNVPARDPVLILGEGAGERRRLLPQPSAADPTRISAEITVTSDDSYALQFVDAFGTAGHEPIRYSIRARPDSPPGVRVDTPAGLTEVVPGEAIAVQASAEDDFGLTRAAFSYRRSGGPAVELPLVLHESSITRASIDQKVSLSRADLRPGDVVEWWVSVWDNREDAAGKAAYQRTDSAVGRLLIRGQTPPRELAQAEGRSTPKGSRNSATQPERREPSSQPSSPAQSERTSVPESQPSSGSEAGMARSSASQPADPLQQFASEHAREIEVLSKALLKESRPSSSPADGDARKSERGETTSAPAGEAKGNPGAAESRPALAEADSSQPAAAAETMSARASVKSESTSRPAFAEAGSPDQESNAHPEPQPTLAEETRSSGSQPASDTLAGSEQARETVSTQPGEDTLAQRERPRETADTQPASNALTERDGSESAGTRPATGESASSQPSHLASATTAPDGMVTNEGSRETTKPESGAGSESRRPTDEPVAELASTSGKQSQSTDQKTGSSEASQDSGEKGKSQQGAGQQTGDKGTSSSERREKSSDASSEKSEQAGADGKAGQQANATPQAGKSGSQGQTGGEKTSAQSGALEKTSSDGKGESATNQPEKASAAGGEKTEQAGTNADANQQAGAQSGKASSEGQQKDGEQAPNDTGAKPGDGGVNPNKASGDPRSADSGKAGEKESAPDAQTGSKPQSGQSGQEGSGEKAAAEPTGGKPAECKSDGGQASGNKPGESSGNKESGEGSRQGSNPTGGGGPAGGSTPPPPDKPAPEEEMPPVEHRTGPGETLEVPGSLDRLVNALDVALRKGELDPELLHELNWDPPAARQFVDAYRQAAVAGQRQTARSQTPEATSISTLPPSAPKPIQRSRGAEGDVRGPGQSNRSADQMRDLQDPARQRVTRQYRPILEAYYRSLSSQPAK